MAKLEQIDEHLNLSRRYLAFLWLAFHSDTGRFRNFLGYDRKWLEDVGSEDSHGRALWALGSVLGHSQNAGLRGAAGRLFEAAVPAVLKFSSPRAWAFSILGLQAYLDWFPGDRAMQGDSQHARQSSAGYLRTQPFRDLALVREESFLLQCEAVAGAHPRRRAQRKQKNDGGGNRVARMAVRRAALR